MSILVRLKNKLHDPSVYETKIREFDECMSHLKTENAELHKRIDQLEALYKTSMRTQHAHFLEEYIRQLEQENERLFIENQCQRQEYERFLDQLTTMVIRTAVMQEKIRKECASIYHVIERLSILTVKAIETKEPLEFQLKEKRRSLSWENLTKSCEIFSSYQMPKLTENLIQSQFSLSSNSSSTTNCSISTLDSWTINKSLDRHRKKGEISVSNKPKEEIEDHEEQQDQVLQRSETFTVSKMPQEEFSSSMPIITLDHPNSQHHPTFQKTVTPAKLTTERSLRLPSRSSTLKTQSSTTNRSSSVTQKTSKLPIRTTNSTTKQVNSVKKSYIPISTVTKTKSDISSVPNRSTPSKNTNNITPKKALRPTSTAQTSSCKTRSRSATTGAEKTNTKTTLLVSKSIKTNLNSTKPNTPIVQQINSPSSDSSIEERENINKLLSILQDEGYSTWSSMDVKDERITNIAKKIETKDKQANVGLIKTWLDTSKRSYLNNPVNEVQENKQEHVSSRLNSYDNNYSTEDASLDVPSAKISSSNKDISLDSLDSPQSKELPILSSNTFSRSETYDKPLITPTSPNIIVDLDDSTSSSSSSSSSTFNMREYVEDHFLDENDSTSSDDSSSYETMIINKKSSLKPQKRLLFPGVLNRLIFFRRTLSDSDLQQKKFHLNEIDNQYHVYHSNIINEHSVEINLMNTYGSDTELHVWSNNCAEQRKFLSERQIQLTSPTEDNNMDYESSNQQLALERQILLQQIYEYPWLLQENDLDPTILFSSKNNQQTLGSPSSDLIVPTHNPDFYQLCTVTNSSSFVNSHDSNGKLNSLTTTMSNTS